MMLPYFESLETGIQAKILAEPERPNAKRKYALEIARLGKRLYSGTDRVAWCGVLVPFDLLSTMGITSCFVEFVGAMLASTGMVAPFLEEAEVRGFASEACGYHRAVLGATEKGIMPVPDFLVATSGPCTGGLAVLETLARKFDRELLVLQVPQEGTATAVRYLANQIENMSEYVARRTGQPFDEERLREAVEKTNKTRELMSEVYTLAQETPSPVKGSDLSNFGIVMALFLGTDAGIEVAESYRNEFAARVESGVSGVANEKLRLMWMQNRIQFKNPVIKMLEDEFGACIVVDELNSITWDPIDPDDPYAGLARRAISIPFNGTVERRVEHLKKLAQEYGVDGAINPCHWGCRQGTGARGLIEEALREIGVPVLNLEVDCIDHRNFADGQIRTRLEAFVEMLYSRGTRLHS